MHSRVIKLTAAAVTLVSLGGCSGEVAAGDPRQSDRGSNLSYSQEEMRIGSLPLDEYIPKFYVASYATQLLIRECMAARGIDYKVARVNFAAPPPATANNLGRRIFNISVAREFGYHFAPSQRVDRKKLQEFAKLNYDQVALSACASSAEQQIPFIESLAEQLAFGIDVSADDAVEEGVASWRECMKDRIPSVEVTDWPPDMPSESDAVSFGLPTASEWDATPAGDDEKKLATIDAECRESSGFQQAYYGALVKAQRDAIAENEHALRDNLAEIARVDESAQEVIQRLGGTAS